MTIHYKMLLNIFYSINTLIKINNFPPRNRQNNFFLLMWDKYGRLIPKSFGIWSFWGYPRPVSGRKVIYFAHCILLTYLPVRNQGTACLFLALVQKGREENVHNYNATQTLPYFHTRLQEGDVIGAQIYRELI